MVLDRTLRKMADTMSNVYTNLQSHMEVMWVKQSFQSSSHHHIYR